MHCIRTMLGSLAFSTAAELDQVRLGVLMGSVASGLLGFAVLRFASRSDETQELRNMPATSMQLQK